MVWFKGIYNQNKQIVTIMKKRIVKLNFFFKLLQICKVHYCSFLYNIIVTQKSPLWEKTLNINLCRRGLMLTQKSMLKNSEIIISRLKIHFIFATMLEIYTLPVTSDISNKQTLYTCKISTIKIKEIPSCLFLHNHPYKRDL